MIQLKTLSRKKTKNNKIRTLLVGAMALVAGFANGFLGTGGGIILMGALTLLPESSGDAARDRFAAVIAVILPISLLSAVVYGKTIDFAAAAPYLVPGALGGITGAFLLDRLNPKLLKRLFAVMMIWAGILFLV